jgi:LPXTG-motif cell wall-anchored protein
VSTKSISKKANRKLIVGLCLLSSPGLLGVALPSAEAGIFASSIQPSSTIPEPTIHYTFDTDLLDMKNASTLNLASPCPVVDGPCNTTSGFGSDANGKYWTWSSTDNRGGGFTLETAEDIGATHTIALKFSFDDVTSWRKIIDYKNRVDDSGFYYYNENLQFYPYTNQTSLTSYPANTVLDLVIVRQPVPNSSNSDFIVYAVGTDNDLVEIFRAVDTSNESLPHTFTSGGLKTRLGFFFDDLATGSEATPRGKVYDLRIWRNTALTPTVLESAVLRPSAPSTVSVAAATASAQVSWAAVPTALEYVVTVGNQSCTVVAPATSCTISGLVDGQTVTVSVQAVGLGGYSAPTLSSPVVIGASVPSSSSTIASSATTSTTIPVRQVPTEDQGSVRDENQRTTLPQTGSKNSLVQWAVAVLLSGIYLTMVSRSRRRVL